MQGFARDHAQVTDVQQSVHDPGDKNLDCGTGLTVSTFHCRIDPKLLMRPDRNYPHFFNVLRHYRFLAGGAGNEATAHCIAYSCQYQRDGQAGSLEQIGFHWFGS